MEARSLDRRSKGGSGDGEGDLRCGVLVFGRMNKLLRSIGGESGGRGGNKRGREESSFVWGRRRGGGSKRAKVGLLQHWVRTASHRQDPWFKRRGSPTRL